MTKTPDHQRVAIFTSNIGTGAVRMTFPESPVSAVSFPSMSYPALSVRQAILDSDDIDFVLNGTRVGEQYGMSVVKAPEKSLLKRRIWTPERKRILSHPQLAEMVVQLIQTTLELEIPPYNVVLFLE